MVYQLQTKGLAEEIALRATSFQVEAYRLMVKIFSTPQVFFLWDGSRGEETITLLDPSLRMAYAFGRDSFEVEAGDLRALLKASKRLVSRELLAAHERELFVGGVEEAR